MADELPPIAYVFGYGSLVSFTEPLVVAGEALPAIPGRLHGFRRFWGAAMNNWEASETEKHFVDVGTEVKPRIRVAYLDIDVAPETTVNGLAIPADPARLDELDRRELNYMRIDVSAAFRPRLEYRVFAYRGTEAARERCRLASEDEIHVSRQYVGLIRCGFAALGAAALEEYERTTEPLPFPERDLEPRYPAPPSDADD